jgi:diacylglycerol kinase (ATP)
LHVRAILNPRAGVRSQHAYAALANAPNGWQLEIEITNAPGHARELAHESAERGDDAVLAVGGDGTINEVAAGLVGSRTALGVVPAGSGNGLARTLGIALNPAAALVELAAGVRRRMDVGRINGEVFLNVAGIGFDAFISTAFQEWTQPGRRRGILPYVWLSFTSLTSFVPEVWRLETAGQSVELPAFLATFANGRQYGGGAIIAPGARLDNGQLEIIIVDPCPNAELMLNAPRLFLGTIGSFRHYRRWTAPSATLTGQRLADHHRDGEPGGRSARFDIWVEPRALEVLVPRHTAEDAQGPFASQEGAPERPQASAEARGGRD